MVRPRDDTDTEDHTVNIYKITDGEITYIYALTEADARNLYSAEMVEPMDDAEPDPVSVAVLPREQWDEHGIREDDGTRTTFSAAVAEFRADTTPRLLCSTCF